MNGVIGILGLIAAGVVGFLLGKKSGQRPSLGGGGGGNSSLFRTLQGTDGFCKGEVLKKRMKGRSFHWHRVGGCRPDPGSRFEIRLKHHTHPSPLIPPVPSGVDHIRAEVNHSEPDGRVYEYGLWQVLADGRERELEDPELEIGHI